MRRDQIYGLFGRCNGLLPEMEKLYSAAALASIFFVEKRNLFTSIIGQLIVFMIVAVWTDHINLILSNHPES